MFLVTWWYNSISWSRCTSALDSSTASLKLSRRWHFLKLIQTIRCLPQTNASLSELLVFTFSSLGDDVSFRKYSNKSAAALTHNTHPQNLSKVRATVDHKCVETPTEDCSETLSIVCEHKHWVIHVRLQQFTDRKIAAWAVQGACYWRKILIIKPTAII